MNGAAGTGRRALTMSLYERVAAHLIGTRLQRPAEWLRAKRGERFRREHPELAEWFREGELTQQVLDRVLKADTNCIDIGCHIGSFLQMIVTRAPRGRHLAIEPVPHKAANLRRKFAQVTVHEVALSDVAGRADFFVNESQTSYSGLTARAEPGATVVATTVQRRCLDDLVSADTRIGFVKIDVNGAELLALRGGLELLKRDRPFVLLECTKSGLDDYGFGSDEVHALLVGEAGMRIQLLKDWLAGNGRTLDAAAFADAMVYPFKAFNFAVTAVAAGSVTP